jgi:hypothetical protein
MLAKRWHVLTAFAGGCVSTVLIVVVWRADGGIAEPREERDRAPVHETVVPKEPEPRVAAVEPVPVPPPTADAKAAGEPAPESGRSVAEVLAQLEVEYRERVLAARAAGAPSAGEPLPVGATPAPSAIAVAPAVAVAPPAVTLPTAAPAVAPPAVAPPVAPPAVVAPAEPSPVFAAVAMPERREDPAQAADRAARDLYLANLYQMEAYQRQQLAILGYLELLSQSSSGNVTSTPRAPARSSSRSPSFSFPLTNPNNPWGFNLPPTVLAK